MELWNNGDDKTKNREKGLFLSNRQLSIIVSGIIILFFSVFMSGYFWGQRSAVEQFVDKIHNDSFADQIYSSLFSLQEKHTIFSDADMEQSRDEQISEQTSVAHAETEKNTADTQEKTSYYAQLIGFGTRRAADRFVNRLEQRDVFVKVKKRTSKTSRGRIIAWYQVVTKKYADKNELQILVATLIRDEKLKDPRIVVA